MRVLLYASVDLNLIDGSAIWLTSLAQVFAKAAGNQVFLLLKSPLSRQTAANEVIRTGNISLIDPWETGSIRRAAGLSKISPRKRLSSEQAAAAVVSAATRYATDLIVIRDDETAELASEEEGVADRLWCYITDPAKYRDSKQLRRLKILSRRCAVLLCQTEQAKALLLKKNPGLNPAKVHLLPPMIPGYMLECSPESSDATLRIVYTGKFSPGYRSVEMFSVFNEIRKRFPGAELHVAGDKFHNLPPVDNFEEIVKAGLTSPGVIWHGGVSRDKIPGIINKCQFAFSWRTEEFDTNVEMSTKMLEYAALGVPPILNRNAVQETVLGRDYPAYVKDTRDILDVITYFTDNPSKYSSLRKRCQDIAKAYTYEKIHHSICELASAQSRSSAGSVIRVDKPVFLFAGHILHFAEPVMKFLKSEGYKVYVDQWEDHRNHKERISKKQLNKADVIFCEWCLGNAVWYSNNVRPGQQLIIRIHHQEMNLNYVDELNWDAVDELISICPQHFESLASRFPDQRGKIKLIYNALELDRYSIEKENGTEFNLGFIGMVPKRKNVKMAFDILERLREFDSRYSLSILGKGPEEYPWVIRQEEEVEYYHSFFDRLKESRHINAVHFDGFTNDVPAWFNKIGFLLSTSDHEGSHQAVAEAMAAGSIPIIRNWEGADKLYPPELVFTVPEEAVALIEEYRAVNCFDEVRKKNRQFAEDEFSVERITGKILKLV